MLTPVKNSYQQSWIKVGPNSCIIYSNVINRSTSSTQWNLNLIFLMKNWIVKKHQLTSYQQIWFEIGPDSCILYNNKQVKIISSVELESDFFNGKLNCQKTSLELLSVVCTEIVICWKVIETSSKRFLDHCKKEFSSSTELKKHYKHAAERLF